MLVWAWSRVAGAHPSISRYVEVHRGEPVEVRERGVSAFLLGRDGGFGDVYRVVTRPAGKRARSSVEKVYRSVGYSGYRDLPMLTVAEQEAFALGFVGELCAQVKAPLNVPRVFEVRPGNRFGIPIRYGPPHYNRSLRGKEPGEAPTMVLQDVPGVLFYDFLDNPSIPLTVRRRVLARFNRAADLLANHLGERVIRSELDLGGQRSEPFHFFDVDLDQVKGSKLSQGRLFFSVEGDNTLVSKSGQLYLIDPI